MNDDKQYSRRKTIWLQGEICEILEDKNNDLLDVFSFSSLANYCIIKELPNILKKLKMEGTTMYNYALVLKQRKERGIINFIRKEKMSNAYFFDRFFYIFKKLLRSKASKVKILDIIDSYILESQTYKDNQTITDEIKDLRSCVFKAKSFDSFHELLEIEIINI